MTIMTRGNEPRGILYQLVIVFFALAIGIGAAGYFYYQNQKTEIKRQKHNELSAIADLKVNAISWWRKERLADAMVIMKNPLISHEVQLWQENPQDSRRKEDILTWLRALQEDYDYSSVCLIDSEGTVRISTPDGQQLDAHLIEYSLRSSRLKRPVLSNLYRSEAEKAIRLGIPVPILNLQEQNPPAIAVLFLQIDPHEFFYPLIQSWPTPSRTSETLLISREGDDVVFLNELRQGKDTALSLRLPLSNAQLPAAMAASGQVGVVEGVDYRGVPVLASLRSIPDSEWYLVTKVDQEEIYGPIHDRAQIILFLVGLLIVGAGVGLALIWSNQHKEALRRARDELELQVLERTAELSTTNVALHREIRERMQAEEKISKTKAMLQTVFNGISDPLLMVEKNLAVRMLNEASLKYFQISSDEDVIGKTCYELARGECAPCDNCGIRLAIAEGRSVTIERKGPSDPERFEEITVYPAEEEISGFSGAIIRIRDITESKNIEKHLMREDRLSSLGQLSGGIAHEIRNPLAGINLFVDILNDEDKFNRTSQELNILGEIKDNINKINGIIKRILDFSKQSDTTQANLNLKTFIEDTLKLWRTRMSNDGIELRLSLDENLPEIPGDPIELQQVMNNLVQNAVEAMRNGGALSITAQSGVFCFDKNRQAVIVRIQDSGSGIPLDQQKNIFNPFFTTKPTGTGLGLAISHRIVRRHGGIVSFESVPDVGTTFRIELPASPRN